MKKWCVCLALIVMVWSCKKSAPSVDCNTVTVTYSANIKGIVASKCATSGCHSAGSSNGDFTSYTGLYAKYKSGSLKNEVITKQTMPQNGSLTTAEYQYFDCWIAAGAPNN